MSQAEELLNGMSEEIPVHNHPVPDTDTYFVIDPITRQIENTNRKKNVVMQYDHNSERFTFELPRYIDGHDMLECTSATVNVDNIEVVESGDGEEVVESRVNSDAPDMTDLRIHPNDPEKVIISWLISRNSTQLAGILSFHIEFKCVDSSGNVVYEWSTDNFDEIEVRARKKNGEAAVAPHADLLEQWRTRIFGAGDSVMANIAAEGEAQVAAVKAESETQQEAVELKGAQTLDSIPEEYTEVDAMAEEAVRSKGDAIVCEAAGESIVLRDSSNDHIRGLKVFGNSSQVTTKGYQLFNASILPTISKGGATITNNGDGSFTVSGSGTLTENIATLKDYTHEESVRMLKLGMLHCPLAQTMPYCYVQIRNSSTIYFGLTHSRPSFEITQAILDDKDMYIRIGFYGGGNEEIIPGTLKPMLYMDGDGTWEPYTGGKPSPNPEYPQEIVSVENPTIGMYGSNISGGTLTLNHTLHGIPVSSGGNYTDSDGRQWICDEVDLERGVYVQRVGIKDFDGSDDEDWGGVSEVTDNMRSWITVQGACRPEFDTANGIMCSQFMPQVSMNKGAFYQNRDRFFFGGGMTLNEWRTHLQSKPLRLAYVPSTPIETPLTADEIAAFKALRTNYPNTTILNDAGAWMSVKYNADTKSYVDNPKTLKLVDSSTGVVYELKIVNGNLTVNPV